MPYEINPFYDDLTPIVSDVVKTVPPEAPQPQAPEPADLAAQAPWFSALANFEANVQYGKDIDDRASVSSYPDWGPNLSYGSVLYFDRLNNRITDRMTDTPLYEEEGGVITLEKTGQKAVYDRYKDMAVKGDVPDLFEKPFGRDTNLQVGDELYLDVDNHRYTNDASPRNLKLWKNVDGSVGVKPTKAPQVYTDDMRTLYDTVEKLGGGVEEIEASDLETTQKGKFSLSNFWKTFSNIGSWIGATDRTEYKDQYYTTETEKQPVTLRAEQYLFGGKNVFEIAGSLLNAWGIPSIAAKEHIGAGVSKDNVGTRILATLPEVLDALGTTVGVILSPLAGVIPTALFRVNPFEDKDDTRELFSFAEGADPLKVDLHQDIYDVVQKWQKVGEFFSKSVGAGDEDLALQFGMDEYTVARATYESGIDRNAYMKKQFDVAVNEALGLHRSAYALMQKSVTSLDMVEREALHEQAIEALQNAYEIERMAGSRVNNVDPTFAYS
jgi:hypothetical protein